MGKTISALAARIRKVEIVRPLLFVVLFSIPLDYFLPNVNFVLLFSFIFWLIVKEDAQTRMIDMRLAFCLMAVSLFLNRNAITTFLYFAIGWMIFKSLLYLSAKYEPAGEAETKASQEVSEPQAASSPEEGHPLPFIPYFCGGVFLSCVLGMCFVFPWDETQQTLSFMLQIGLSFAPSIQIGTHVIPSIVVASFLVSVLLFLLSYGRLRYMLHHGKQVRYAMGGGDPSILAVFFGILPLVTFMLAYFIALLLTIGGFLVVKRRMPDVSNG